MCISLLISLYLNIFFLCLSPVPVNINGYVPILKNTLDAIVRGSNLLSLRGVVTRLRLPDVVAGEAHHSRHTADPPRPA